MKRSLQEYVELVVFGLIALLVGTGLLWLLGWVLSLGGVVLKGLAGLLWMLLRFIVPVAIAGGLVYFLVKAAQDRQKPAPAAAGSGSTGSGGTAARGGVIDVAPANAAGSGGQSAASTVSEAVAAAGDTVAEAVDDLGATDDPAVEDANSATEDIADAAADDMVDDADDSMDDEDDEDEPRA